jgi:hypothetical protein
MGRRMLDGEPVRVSVVSALVLISACAQDTSRCEGQALFGRPSARTGLDAARCAPRCDSCGGEPWVAPEPTSAQIDALLGLVLLEPPALLASDPYAGLPSEPPVGVDPVCGVVKTSSSTYRLATYESAEAAREDGSIVTHYGACGLCSSLQDLAIYMRYPDLTEPVRACGLRAVFEGPDVARTCIEALGFTRPCAQIWWYNTLATRERCAEPCFAALDQPYHLPSGALNACLACDEAQSGAVFKAVAGRTRRNTGLANSMCRPCAEVRPLAHDYR